jgi:hypothetical protein
LEIILFYTSDFIGKSLVSELLITAEADNLDLPTVSLAKEHDMLKFEIPKITN